LLPVVLSEQIIPGTRAELRHGHHSSMLSAPLRSTHGQR
jgi:hypothetical protein